MYEPARQRRAAARARERFIELLTAGSSPADAYREIQEGRGAPARSTAYEWAREWKAQRDQDDSGEWTLATDTTGRPDVVMRILASLGNARIRLLATGRDPDRRVVSVAEARWAVKVAEAVPWILSDAVDQHLRQPRSDRTAGYFDAPLALLMVAQRYASAVDDGRPLHQGVDAEVAQMFVRESWDNLTADGWPAEAYQQATEGEVAQDAGKEGDDAR